MTNIATHVSVGEIIDMKQHPTADRLQVCQVQLGTEVLQVITASTTVSVGAKVAVAIHGARLHGDIKIKKGKLRGELSQGMFCGAAELGLGDSDGVLILPADAKTGEPLPEQYKVPDLA